MENFFKKATLRAASLACCLFSLFMGGCTGPSLVLEEVMLPTGVYQQLPANSGLKGAVQLGEVRVAQNATEGMAPIDAENFKKILLHTLSAANYGVLNNDPPRLYLEASVLVLERHGFCYSVDGLAKVHYTLKNATTQETLWDETIVTTSYIPYRVFENRNKLRLACVLALQENLIHLLRVLASNNF